LTDFGLGIFNEFWDEAHPHHLPLLNLQDAGDPHWNLTISIQRLNAIVEKNSEPSVWEGVRFLLDTPNWRPHLVACLVLLRLSSPARATLQDLFWDRISLGSWVSPQILVTLSLVDGDFKMKGEKILRGGFAANVRRPSSPDPVSQGHTRPSPSEQKVKAAIEFLVNNVIIDSSDNDAGGSHASDWKQRLLKLIESKKIASRDIL
jgi:hypothetical protein